MRGVGACVLAVYAVITAAQLPVWRSDRTLWHQAWRSHPELPRVMLNYGLSVSTSDPEQSLQLLVRAFEAADRSPRRAEIQAVVRQRLLWQEAFGEPVCSRPSVQSVCSSF
jgi:hypothetical protein